MRIFILSIVFVLATIADAFAYDFIEGGIAYNILANGTLSVTHKWEKRPSKKDADPNTIIIDIPSEFKLYRGRVKIPPMVKHEGKEYKVTEIGYRAFENCKELTSLILPEGLRRMEFYSIVMTRIKSLNIPSSVTEIVPGAVLQCNNLKNLTVSPGNPKYVSEGNCIYTKNMKELLMVSPTLKSYEFPSSVTSVADYAFDSSTLTRLVIPNTLEYIGGTAFHNTYMGSVACDKILKKLPDSDNYNLVDSLPLWAIGKGKYEPLERKMRNLQFILPNSIYDKRAKQAR